MRYVFGLFSFLFFFSAAATTVTGQLSYQGRIIKPNGLPLEGPSVSFTLQILSPGASACVLYEETHTRDMSGTGGVFSLTLGGGVRDGNDPGLNFKDIFSNSLNFAGPLTCASGNSYTPLSGHGRKLRLSFNDGSGSVTVNPAMDIQSVPYAFYAEKLQGKGLSDLLQVSSGNNLTQTNLQNVFTGANYTDLMDLIAGNSGKYIDSTPNASVSFNSQKLTNLADPVSAQDAATKNYCDANMGGNALDDSDIGIGIGDGKVLTWDAAGNKWVAEDPITGMDNLGNHTATTDLDMDGSKVTNMAEPAAAQDAATKNYVDTKLIGKTLPAAPAATENGKALKYDHGSGAWVYYTPISDGADNLGDHTATQNIELGPNYLTGDGTNKGIFIDADGKVGVGDAHNNPVAVLDIKGNIKIANSSNTCSATHEGEIRYDIGTHALYFCSDTGWKEVGDAAASGVVSIFSRSGTVTAQAGDYTASQITNVATGNIAATTVQAAINELDTEKVAKSGDTMSGPLAMSANKITGLGDPTAAQDAATKSYVDGRILGQTLAAPTGGETGKSIRWSGAAWEYYTPSSGTASSSTQIIAGDGLTGGGDLSANRTLAVDINGVTAEITADDADKILIYDNSAAALKSMTRGHFLTGVASITDLAAKADDADVLKKDGSVPLTANWNVGNRDINNVAGMSIGAASPDASAALDVSSTTKGFLPPRMTTAQRMGIASPAEGLILFDTTEDTLFIYKGGAWSKLADITEVSFRALKTSTQSMPTAGTWYRINWEVEDYDIGSSFDLDTDRFQPTVPGKYLIVFQAATQTVGDGQYFQAGIYKNGIHLASNWIFASGNQAIAAPVTAVVPMNGTTDYIEFFGVSNASSQTLYANTTYTYAQGFLISGGTGGGGGGAADHLGNHTATQNIALVNHWLSSDGDNEGIQIDGSGNVTFSGSISGDGSGITNIDASTAIANNSISVDKLDFASSNGVNIPQLAADPLSPTNGQIYYNTVNNKLMVYNGSSWTAVGSDGTGAFALVTKSAANQTLSSGVTATVNFNTETADTGGFFDAGTSTTRLTVPAGVTTVRVCGNIGGACTATASRQYSWIRKNGSDSYPGIPIQITSPADNSINHAFCSGPMNVTAGDYFELVGQASNADCTPAPNRTWMSIEQLNGTTIASNGSGTANYVPQWTAASSLGNSPIAVSGSNVGIGTASPTGPLHVQLQPLDAGSARFFAPLADGQFSQIKLGYGDSGFEAAALRFGRSASGHSLSLFHWGESYGIHLKQGGNVGIGTNNPTNTLVVDGTSQGENDSAILAYSSTNKDVFSVLPWNGITYLGSGVYYKDGSWIHDGHGANNALFAFSGSNGGIWYASNNSSPSFNVASSVQLWTAAGVLVGSSSRDFKENFTPIDRRAVLDRIAGLNISRWNYKGNPHVSHIGPIAEEWAEAFGTGEDDKHIPLIDEAGVALAGIQELYEMCRMTEKQAASLEERLNTIEKKHERDMASLKEENRKLRNEVQDIRDRMENLEKLIREKTR